MRFDGLLGRDFEPRHVCRPAAPQKPLERLLDRGDPARLPKRPRDVRFLEALPRNDMGKVQKARLGDA